MRNRLPLLLLMLAIAIGAAAQIYPQWAVHAGGASYDYPGVCYTDDAGNTYVTGHFKADAWFGEIMLSSAGDRDVFVAKLSVDGEWLWAVRAGGAGSDIGSGIAVDPQGYVYVGGSFSQTVSFGSTSLTVIGGSNSDLYIAKLSPAGEWVWAKSGGGTGYDSCTEIALDPMGDIRIGACFTSPASFGSFAMTGPAGALGFVASLSSAGEWQWVQRTGTPNGSSVTDIVVGPEGNCYFCGIMNSNSASTFGNTTLQGAGGQDVCTGALDSQGNWLWAASGGGSGSDQAHGIALFGNTLYIAASVEGSFSFGGVPYSTSGWVDACVAAISTAGQWQWIVCCGGSGYDVGTCIDVDSQGKVVLCGYYTSTVMFCGTIQLLHAGGADVFVARLNSSGDWLDAAKGGGSGDETSYAVQTDAVGDIYVLGYFDEPCAFGNTTISSNGDTDLYVAKFGANFLALDMAALELTGSIAPNLNMPNSYYVLVQNRGLTPVSDYLIKLTADIGMVLETVSGPPLAPGETATVEIVWHPSTLGLVYLNGKVELAGDLYAPNDATTQMLVTVQQPGTLAGMVREYNNAPIAGATITCTGPVTASTISSANGTYSIYLPEGLYNVTAHHVGFAPVTHSTVVLMSGLTTTLHFWLFTSADDDPCVPEAVSSLLNCSPNPFREQGRIAFSIKEASPASITLYDLRGRMVARLWEGMLSAGTGSVVWDGRDARGKEMPAGIYLCRMVCGKQESSLKIVLLRGF